MFVAVAGVGAEPVYGGTLRYAVIDEPGRLPSSEASALPDERSRTSLTAAPAVSEAGASAGTCKRRCLADRGKPDEFQARRKAVGVAARATPGTRIDGPGGWGEEEAMEVASREPEETVVIRGCRPIGFANGSEIGRELSCDSGRSVDLEGGFVSPGWIDLHTHIYYGGTDISVDPDVVGPSTGVVMPVDAGSAGEGNFLGFREFLIARRTYPIRAFLNIGAIGLVAGNRVSEIAYSSSIHYSRTKRCIEENRDVIKGIKVRATRNMLGDPPSIQPVITAKRLAAQLELPLMVHIGEPPIFLDELVDLLEAGDVITHCFHGNGGYGLAENPERGIGLYRASVEKGIHLDIGHGAASFDYTACQLALRNGILPHTISSDVHVRNVDGPVWCLATVMSKLLAVGLDFETTIRCVTLHPAQVLKEPGWGTVEEGTVRTFTIFQCERGDFRFCDTPPVDFLAVRRQVAEQKTFAGREFLVPRFAFWGAGLHEAAPRGLEAHRAAG